MTVETVIEPNRSWLRIPWREVAQYRDLLFLLVRRDFVAKYKQTILGPAWFILQPLMHTVVFTVVFGKLAGLSTGGLPKPLFYFSGLLAWQYFAQCLGGTSATFVANQSLFGKVYFPRLVAPLSVVISSLLAYALVFATFLCFFLYYRFLTPAGRLIHAGPAVAALPLVVLHTAALGLGVGLWMSALTAKYRDFSHLAGFLQQLWMYATLPIFMDVAEISRGRWAWVLAANPVCSIVRWYRAAFLGLGTVDAGHYAVSVAVTVVLLLSGLLVFSRVERTFIDTV